MQNLRLSKAKELAQGQVADRAQDLNLGPSSHKAVTVPCHPLLIHPWPCLRKHAASFYFENEWGRELEQSVLSYLLTDTVSRERF